MRLAVRLLAPVLGVMLLLAAHGLAEPAEEPLDSPESAEAAGSDPVSDPESPAQGADLGEEPAEAEAAQAPPAEANAGAASEDGQAAASNSVALGPVGYDAQGRPGRVHLVVAGDTLWDISEAYLGTPWVWPSVWQDNEDIANPHLIYPGDRIWITPNEMRRITEAEAEALLAGTPAQEFPASLEDASALPDESRLPELVYSFTGIEAKGLVSQSQLDAAASIVDSPVDRIWLAEPDTLFLGLGDGQVEVGDQFTLFREVEKVLDPQTGKLFGYHVDVLGWAEVTEVEAESSVATIRRSYSEMQRGDRALPRERPESEIEVRTASQAVEGHLLYMPGSRTQGAEADLVYLDRGQIDGLEIGNPVEVYRPGGPVAEEARDTIVRTPDWVVAKLLVISTQENSAVALVTHSTSTLERGDRFRTSLDTQLR